MKDNHKRNTFIQEAIKLDKREKFIDLINLCETNQLIFPFEVSQIESFTLSELGNRFAREGSNEHAIKCYKRAIINCNYLLHINNYDVKANHNKAAALLNLYLLDKNLNRCFEAMICCNKIFEIKPDCIEVRHMLNYAKNEFIKHSKNISTENLMILADAAETRNKLEAVSR